MPRDFSRQDFIKLTEYSIHNSDLSWNIYLHKVANNKELHALAKDLEGISDFEVDLAKPLKEYEVDVLVRHAETPKHHNKLKGKLKWKGKVDRYLRDRAIENVLRYFVSRTYPHGMIVPDGYSGDKSYVLVLHTPTCQPTYIRYEGNEQALDDLYDHLFDGEYVEDLKTDTMNRFSEQHVENEWSVIDAKLMYEETIQNHISMNRKQYIRDILRYGGIRRFVL